MSLTPQQRWARKQKNAGRCSRCGRKLGRYSWLCNHCQEKSTAYMRRYREAQKAAQKAKDKALGNGGSS